MNTSELASLLFLIPGAVLSWAACHWRYGRRIRRSERRAAKLHADREALNEQVRRARQQVAQLQQDLTSLQTGATAQLPSAPAPAPSPPPAPASKEAPRAKTITSQLDIPSGLVFEPTQVTAHGFAETMPFPLEETT